jgi:hypothetical protein
VNIFLGRLPETEAHLRQLYIFGGFGTNSNVQLVGERGNNSQPPPCASAQTNMTILAKDLSATMEGTGTHQGLETQRQWLEKAIASITLESGVFFNRPHADQLGENPALL